MVLDHVKRCREHRSDLNITLKMFSSKASNSALSHFLCCLSLVILLLLLFLLFLLPFLICFLSLLWLVPLLHISVWTLCVMCSRDSFSRLQLTSLSLSLVCANYSGLFVTKKNALKLTLMPVKTKQMVFPAAEHKKTKCCCSELLKDSHVAER